MKILIITGSYLISKENKFSVLLKKQLTQLKQSQHTWLELLIKIMVAQPLLVLEVWKGFYRRWSQNLEIRQFLNNKVNQQIPSLTEVSLMTLIHAEGLQFEAINVDELLSQSERAQRLLQECSCVFLSTTYLRDLSELDPLLPLCKKEHNRVVVGGPLAATLAPTWQGHPDVDVMAVGYGEMLVPEIANWIKSGFKVLNHPARGRLQYKGPSAVVYSGVPESLSLDELPTPNWQLAQRYYGEQFQMAYYESVRGCPYRCAFCNYPYLFDDSKFRTRSAMKMADDWEYLAKELKIEYITCLDSLFTMPRQRMYDFCEELIRRDIKLKWVCYARADDLNDEKLVQLMARAGAIQVQIGIESGDDQQLKNMNKRTTVAINLDAVQNCRKYGITSLVTLIVGFPGETEQSLANTLEFMRQAKPDLHFVIPFSTRVENVPILSPANRKKYSLEVMENRYSVSPYWDHETMSCRQAVNHAKRLSKIILNEGLSLDAASFYNHILNFKPAMKPDLIQMQTRALLLSRPVIWFFDILFWIFDWALKIDFERWVREAQNKKLKSLSAAE